MEIWLIPEKQKGLWSSIHYLIRGVNVEIIWFKGGQMAEWLGSRAINQKVVGSIPGSAE